MHLLHPQIPDPRQRRENTSPPGVDPPRKAGAVDSDPSTPLWAREQSQRWPQPGRAGHRCVQLQIAGRGVLRRRRQRPTEGLHEPKEIADTR
ncbi:unnamed protein product [Nyctereutes procyonoides]|uniref:(raccoon dog) hypothetical protein n=1 Tax=Nyctereutes procyonoides TaxID=34880 RepID=A0A811ZWZ2_NYCPR|nr:unnamed protein product [Nyctereutes procyonoides]